MNVNPTCFCGQPETLVHLFTSCPLVRDLLVWFTLQLNRYDPLVILTDGDILFGFSSASRIPLVFSALLGILRHQVWLARNKHRFENIAPCSQDSLRKAKSTFRFMVRLQKRHNPVGQFTHEWLADGIVG
ncbi:Hypothetical predicted protein, partial [Paramuricea clavata]